MPRRSRRLPSVVAATFAFVTLFAALGWATFSFMIEERLAGLEVAVQTASVADRSSALGLNFEKALEREWHSIQAVASTVSVADAASAQGRLRALANSMVQIDSVSVIAASGDVVASSDPARVGRDVGGQPWFRRGLAAGYVGEEEGASAAERLRYLNMAVPIETAGGRVNGVLSYRLEANWMARYLEEGAEALRMDVVVVDSAGDAVFEAMSLGRTAYDSVARATVTSRGAGVYLLDEGPSDPVLIAVPEKLAQAPFNALDWRIVAMVPADIAGAGYFALSRAAGGVLFAFGSLLLIGTYLFVAHFIRPLSTLARDAEALIAGQETYPREVSSSREGAAISSALARLSLAGS